MCGHGVMMYAALRVLYAGEWSEGEPHGAGVLLHLPDQEEYLTQFIRYVWMSKLYTR